MTAATLELERRSADGALAIFLIVTFALAFHLIVPFVRTVFGTRDVVHMALERAERLPADDTISANRHRLDALPSPNFSFDVGCSVSRTFL
jgi:hypothetical protein